MMSASSLLGTVFAGPEGTLTTVPAADLDDCDVVGLYFSAHWCPPCKAFTPQLVSAYNAMQNIGKKFQIVFVSSDRSQSEFQEYFNSMHNRCAMLSSKYKVLGIPKLVFIKGSDASLITMAGREAITRPELFPWDNFQPSLGSCIDVIGNCTVS